MIWLVHALTNGGGFIATNVLLWRGHTDNIVYIGLWSAILAVNFALIGLLKRRRAGVRSFVETQLYAIWLTFIAAVMLTAVVNHLMKLPLFGLGPIIAVLSGFGFAMMGATMGRRWFIAAGVFAAMALVMALVPSWQFVLLGVVWMAMQLAGGCWLVVEKRRQRRSGQQPPRIV